MGALGQGGTRALSWGCQGSGCPQLLLPFPLGPSPPHRGSAGAFPSPLVPQPWDRHRL